MKIRNKIPFLKEYYKICRAYIFSGDNKFLSSKIPTGKIFQQLGLKLLFCFIFTSLIFLTSLFLESMPKPGAVNDLIMGIFPDLLGFGIGVYALIYVLPSRQYNEIKKKFDSGQSVIQPTTLNSEMAYPIIAMCSVLLFSIILEFLPYGKLTIFLNLFLLIYGMAMVFELVYSIFLFTQKHLTDLTKSD